jgi:hypothetical protein
LSRLHGMPSIGYAGQGRRTLVSTKDGAP